MLQLRSDNKSQQDIGCRDPVAPLSSRSWNVPRLFTHFLFRSAAFDSEPKKVRAIQLLLQLLPKDNYLLLQALLALLNSVAAHARTTRMTSETLGLLLAPHVLASRPTDAEQLREQVTSGENAALMALLIAHSQRIFQVSRHL